MIAPLELTREEVMVLYLHTHQLLLDAIASRNYPSTRKYLDRMDYFERRMSK